MDGGRETEKGGWEEGICAVGQGGEAKGSLLQVSKSWVSLLVLAAQTGQGVAGEQGGWRIKGRRWKSVEGG